MTFTIPSRRTDEEIKSLKEQWKSDPCWDIEETEGFEAHKQELRAYRIEQETRWRDERKARLAKKAEKYGCEGNIVLAATIELLEMRLEKLEAERQ